MRSEKPVDALSCLILDNVAALETDSQVPELRKLAIV
jgi:hypothetical protein